MNHSDRFPGSLTLGVLLCLVACAPREEAADRAPAPVDTSAATSDTLVVSDSGVMAAPDTGVATPPITPSQPLSPDSSPAGAQAPSDQPARLSPAEYEGWRQYSVNCARCHGQDVLPNPVAANLLVSLAPGGPMDSPDKFAQVVSEGRPERGMPAFKSILTPGQSQSIYAYVKGRAHKRIPPGRPASPTG